RVQLPPAPPIMIGRCKDNTSKNRKLEVSAGHKPDRVLTRKRQKYTRRMHVHFKKTSDCEVRGFSICN
ncbi:hypothetical protein NEP96_27280, partial [Escherichia coli]|nr:hypothetical protein [Escherichia coli]